MSKNNWLLPEGIEEFLPEEARALEDLRQRLLAHLNGWGYELVIPPLVEYLDSLLTGTGNDLDLQTYKLIDQNNGRTMGVRADMTPQVARIDAHQLARAYPTRLCYIGTVLHTSASDFSKARSITQLGAELYGHAGDESDIEVISLVLSALESLGVQNLHLDIGHVGIFRGLAQQSGLAAEVEAQLFDALQRKSVPDIDLLLAEVKADPVGMQMLRALCSLHGGAEVLIQARAELTHAEPLVLRAITSVQRVADAITAQFPALSIHFDLAELRGYHYHTGIVFSVYTTEQAQPLAQGGRYDNIGAAFGRARPATGFSADLRSLLRVDQRGGHGRRKIYAPNPEDASLRQEITRLRQAGEIVISALPGQSGSAVELGCECQLIKNNKGKWAVIDVGGHNG